MIIVRDSREKHIWDFSPFGIEQTVHKLSAGDYSIQGYENKIAIERKASTGELYNNLIKSYKTFSKELEKLSSYDEKYLILEFSPSDILLFPANSGIPQRFWSKLRSGSRFLSSRLESVNDFGVTIIFAGNRLDAQIKTLEIFNDYIKRIT